MPGFAVLSSALGAVRGDDGQCEFHQRHVIALGGCGRFALRTLPVRAAASSTSEG
jgi:hypothetical protein